MSSLNGEEDQRESRPLLRQRNVPQATGTSSSSSTTTTSPDSAADTDPMITIRSVTPRLATFSKPFARFGFVPIGGRSTAVQLRDGTVWVLASTPLDARTKAKLQEMGDVRYIVAPDVEHHLFLPQYAAEYPQAKVIGVEGLEEKRKEFEFYGLYGRDPEGTEYGFEDEIQAQYFPTFANKDVVFNHIDTRTLITADLLFNLPPNEQYAATPAGKATSRIPFLMMFVNRVKPSSWLHKAFLGAAGVGAGIPGAEKGGSKQERRRRFARDAAAVASWDFDRIVMCHGDVIETGGKEAWLSAFEKYLHKDGTPKF